MPERTEEAGVHIRRFPFLSKVTHTIDNNIRDFGLQSGSLQTLNTGGVVLKVENLSPVLGRILEESPVVLVANHPTLTEPLVLPAALPQRKDAFMVMSQSFLTLLPRLEQHTLPIFLGSRRENEKKISSLIRRAFAYGEIEYEDAHLRNIESINLAASRVSGGELGIIFPAPLGKPEEGQWKTGLGYLIEGIQYPSETYLIEAYIEGTAWHDVLRAISYFVGDIPKLK